MHQLKLAQSGAENVAEADIQTACPCGSILVLGWPCIHPSIRPSSHACHILGTVQARVLKFHIWIPQGKIAHPYFFFLSKLSPFLELCPFEKIRMKSDACHILWTVHAMVLKFHIWIPHGKVAHSIFFWKNQNEIGKISQSIWLGVWNLVSW